MCVSLCVCEQWALGRSRRGNNKRTGYLPGDMVTGQWSDWQPTMHRGPRKIQHGCFLYFYLFSGKNKRRRIGKKGRKEERRKKREERTRNGAPC